MAQNPADLCSRGIQAHKTEKWSYYHQGPEFLRLPGSQWPEMKVSHQPKRHRQYDQIQVAAAADFTPAMSEEIHASPILDLATRTSGWSNKLNRIASFVKIAKRWRQLQATSRFRQRTRTVTASLEWDLWVSNEELHYAKKRLIQVIQQSTFGKELDELRTKEISHPVSRKEIASKNSPLCSFNPCPDVTPSMLLDYPRVTGSQDRLGNLYSVPAGL